MEASHIILAAGTFVGFLGWANCILAMKRQHDEHLAALNNLHRRNAYSTQAMAKHVLWLERRLACSIPLSPDELSDPAMDRVRWAGRLIQQLPPGEDRDAWLLRYGPRQPIEQLEYAT